MLAAAALTSLVGASPVKVYIMMGQSNMLGEGRVGPATTNGTLEYAVTTQKMYPYMVDSTGAYKTSATVRNVFVMGSGGPDSKVELQSNEFLTAGPEAKGKARTSLGPELGALCETSSVTCLASRSLSPHTSAFPSQASAGSSTRRRLIRR